MDIQDKRSTNIVTHETTVMRGLEGVVAAETDISFVDGENSDLYYKGYNIHDIAEHTTFFTEIIYLLLYSALPAAGELKRFRRRIVSEMRVPTQIIKTMEIMAPSSHPMDVLRTAVSARFVPNEIVRIDQVPRTLSGKKLEVPVKKLLLGGDPARVVNRDSMANPDSFDFFIDYAASRARAPESTSQ